MKFRIKWKKDSKENKKPKKIKIKKAVSKIYNKDNIYTKLYKKTGKVIFDITKKFSDK